MDEQEDKKKVPEDKKKEESTAEYITLKVVGQGTNEVHFRIKKGATFDKLKKSYSQRINVPLTELRFLFEGRRIGDQDTPETMEMEEEDVVEVFQQQTGGALSIKK